MDAKAERISKSRLDKTRHELNPKTWTVSVNRLFDTQSGILPGWSLYIDLCNCLILICSIQHQMKVNLWTKNSYRLWLTN
ncbi:hypothetical protein FCZ44_12710, partial [Escherichia coli]|nr:hypothetical protein [Escherichia coli]